MKTTKVLNKESRKRRVKAKIFGTAEVPRLSVFASNKHVFAQIVDDSTGKTLASASDYEKGSKRDIGTKSEISKSVGKKLAERAKEKKIKKVVFDRGSKLYHGRVKALAESAREAGLEF